MKSTSLQARRTTRWGAAAATLIASTILAACTPDPPVAPPSTPTVTVSSSDLSGVTATVTMPQAQMTERVGEGDPYVGLTVAGATAAGGVGEPEIPVVYEEFAIPLGANFTVDATVGSSTTTEGVELWPHQGPVPAGALPFSTDQRFTKSAAAYTTNAKFPAAVATTSHLGMIGGFDVGQVAIATAQYNPVAKTLTTFENVSLAVHFTGPHEDGFTASTSADVWAAPSAHFAGSLINGQTAPGYTVFAPLAPDFCGEELLIYTTPDLVTQAQRLADARSHDGIRSAVRSYAAGTSPDTIRADFVAEVNSTCRIKPSNVLLFGDSTKIRPFHIKANGFDPLFRDPACGTVTASTTYNGQDACSIPTDLPYGVFSTTSPLADGDTWTPAKFPGIGAGASVGRIPAASDSEAKTMVDKIIAYEDNPPTSATFYNTAIMSTDFQPDLSSCTKAVGCTRSKFSFARGPSETGVQLEAKGKTVHFLYDDTYRTTLQSANATNATTIDVSPTDDYYGQRLDAAVPFYVYVGTRDLGGTAQVTGVTPMNCPLPGTPCTVNNAATLRLTVSSLGLIAHPAGTSVDLAVSPRVNGDGTALPTEMLGHDAVSHAGDHVWAGPVQTEMTRLWNAGAYLVEYHDHGNVDGWQHFRNWDISSLANGNRQPVVVSIACLTGRFDDPAGHQFAEQLIDGVNGAVGVIAGSTESEVRANDGFNVELNKDLLSETYSHDGMSDWSVASSLQIAKAMRATTNDNDWSTRFIYNYFGDPTMRLRLHQPATNVAQFAIGRTSNGLVLTASSAANGARATLVRGNVPVGRALIANGTANLSVEDTTAPDGPLSVVIDQPGADLVHLDVAVTTLAGSPGTPGSGDGVGSSARFNNPASVAVDQSGQTWVTDNVNHTVRLVQPDGTTVTIAGTAGAPGHDDGIGAQNSSFRSPTGVAVAPNGDAIVADTGNHTIRRIRKVAGTPYYSTETIAGTAGTAGHSDGIGASATFNGPQAVTVDPAGNIFVADTSNDTIRRIDTGGNVVTVAGSPGAFGTVDGAPLAARFSNPAGIGYDTSTGTVIVADSAGQTIRRVSLSAVTTVAGAAGSPGAIDGSGSVARFNNPLGIAVAGNGDIYVADASNSSIRKVSAAGAVSTYAGRSGVGGFADGAPQDARFIYPSGVGLANDGTLYVADSINHVIRRIGWPPG